MGSNDTDFVWLSCQGENPADRENVGSIRYEPQPGFATYYFPFINTPGYLAPLVMIQFESLNPGILINVECKAWAKNIIHSRMERRGSVHFEILMD
jgi:sodium/potassium-transporting ATPase subunit beta